MKRYDSYKDSGVKWLGKIPSHWEVSSLRHLGLCSKKIVDPKKLLGTEIYEYSMPAFDNGKIPDVTTGDRLDSSKLLLEEYSTPQSQTSDPMLLRQ